MQGCHTVDIIKSRYNIIPPAIRLATLESFPVIRAVSAYGSFFPDTTGYRTYPQLRPWERRLSFTGAPRNNLLTYAAHPA